MGRRHSGTVVTHRRDVEEPVRALMRFLLDTDSESFALRGHGEVGARIRERKPSELCISATNSKVPGLALENWT